MSVRPWFGAGPEYEGKEGLRLCRERRHAGVAAADGPRGGEFCLFWFPIDKVLLKKN